LRAANPKARALVLSATFDRAMAAAAIECGAAAVLDKMTQLGELAQTARRIVAGEASKPTRSAR
jgi:DNA-binding NarL/FixJ family response regulator